MTISAWPLDAVNGAPTYSGRVLRQTTNAPLLAGASASRPLGALSGVRPGTSTSTVVATSTAWMCAPVAGVIDGEAAAEAGPYTFASDANVTGSVTAANASNPRIDIVYVQVSDPAEADGSPSPAVTISYLAGSPNATPSAPTTPARSFVLAQITVPKVGGGSPSVTWVAPYSAAAGAIVPAVSSAQLSAMTPAAGSYVDLIRTSDAANYPLGLYRGNGAAWVPIAADTQWLPLPAFSGNFTADNSAAYRKIGNVVYLRGQVTRKTGSLTSGDGLFTMNPGTRPANLSYFSPATGPGASVRISIASTGLATIAGPPSAGLTYVMLDGVSYIADQ